MKWWKIWKDSHIRSLPRFEHYQYNLYLNEEQILDVTVWSTLSHHETYKKIRNFKKPQYNNFYVLRNKKGFNTINFIQKYDVLIANISGIIIDLLTNIEPGFISNNYQQGYFVYFCPVGTINFYNLQKRDLLQLARRWLIEKN